MELSYRIATHKDIKAIREIANKTWFVTYEPILGKEQPKFMFDTIYSEEALSQQMDDGQTFVLQILGDDILAFASFSIKDNSQTDTYKLNKLYLNPEFQGGGYGKKLISFVEEKVKALGAMYLDLNVNRYNKARFFYEKVGFVITKEEDIPIGEYWMNDFVMRKVLG
ncbi:MAG: GNAT family N-acetyltransferase [Emticicia sp.]|uniref:GNAT family N-acetyltransferase n=1 Tax=Emticicia sp. TaxID=1930953 RepID=UPI003BA468FA